MKTILVDAVDCLVSQEGVIFREIHELLDSYPNRKVIVTNAPKTKFRQYNLDSAPYEVFTLENNPRKTETLYFQTLCKELGVEVNNLIYIEHNPEAADSARSIGINTYNYDNNRRDLVSLKKYLDGNA